MFRSPVWRGLLWTIAVAMSGFHLYTGAFGALEGFLQKLVHISFAFALLFLHEVERNTSRVDPENQTARERVMSLLSRIGAVVCLAMSVAALSYLFINYDYVMSGRFPYISGLSNLQIVLGLGFSLVVIEAARRTMGISIAIVALLFLLYPFAGPYLPSIFWHPGKSLTDVVDGLIYTSDGIFGIALSISANFVVLYIIFAAFLEVTGFSDFMLAFAKGVAGRLRGGPAKIAILSSALVGMVTGSAVANVMASGSFSIPLMKRTGYTKNFAGAVEAAASTGSQFMPPVMGAQAFIMAQFTGVPYALIALYSLAPAVLYYFGLWVCIHLEARRLGLHGLEHQEIGAWRREALGRAHMLVPIAVLIGVLASGRTETYAAVAGVVALVIVSMLRKNTRIGLFRFFEAMRRGAEMTVPVVAATAVAGIIVLSVTLTGLGDRFSAVMIAAANGNLGIALVYAMLASLVLGMGLPTVPAYIVQVGLIVPALVKMGLNLVAAHLFVIYFACLSMITPPVAIAAYAAAGISGGDAFKTGFIASKLAIAGFIVPFIFVVNPALLLIGQPIDIVRALFTTAVAIYGLSLMLNGYLYRPIAWWERGVALIGALLLIYPSLPTDIIGTAIVLSVVLRQRLTTNLNARETSREPSASS
jgi:TRAP transporter 4TM/12TM fusion protein